MRGFREAIRGSAKIVGAIEHAAPLLRAVHARFATRGDSREWQVDDQGGIGLPLSRYNELVWEAGLIGRELSRNAAKACFVNSLHPGDALAGITEFGEVVIRLAHALSPLSREERVGAPPPPGKGEKKATGADRAAAKQAGAPALLVANAGGVALAPAAEAMLMAKLHAVIAKLATVATDFPDSPRAVEFARRYVNPAPQHETPAAMPTPQKFPQQMDGADTSADSADDAEPGNEQRADGDAATPPSGDPSALP